MNGVVVDFTDPCINPNTTDTNKHDGCANGDGQYEPLDAIEVVVGSPYDDHFVTGGDSEIRRRLRQRRFNVPVEIQIVDGGGNDTWNGKPYGGAGGSIPANKVFVYVENHDRDLGVVIIGTAKRRRRHDSSERAEATQIDGNAGDHGERAAARRVTSSARRTVVAAASRNTLRWVAAYGERRQ